MKNTITSFTGEYAFLSNFYVLSNGSTVEHAFQAAKTVDPEEKACILAASTPGNAKRLGRKVTLRPDWDIMKLDIMFSLLEMKFNFDPVLADKLINTGDAELVEGNTWHDTYWGVCTCSKCGNQGNNHLGKLLMQVRDTLVQKNILGV